MFVSSKTEQTDSVTSSRKGGSSLGGEGDLLLKEESDVSLHVSQENPVEGSFQKVKLKD